ncbi:MAG: hsp70 family protein [Myxococcales bacterium]|nr:hsp70 family protein [Myxococcales bacterium]
MPATHVVGIDLGTTHCAVAASPIGRAAVTTIDLPQLVAPGEVAARTLLPSFLYLPAPGEFADADLRLPWGPAEAIVGELARQRGAQVPGRLVASAKSWICHGGVDRRAPILPWSAPDGEPHVSPYTAQVRYLAHLRAAWDHAHPHAPLAEQDVVVTVPASFDEIARELTADAAREAGLATVRLIEEPQAALYDFLGAHPDDLADALGPARLVLVIDVGGGTTDLTLVRVHPATDGEPPTLERIAVGGHLMLGGDNMDAALAHHVLAAAGIDKPLDPTEWAALVQSARRAKEQLLAADAPPEARVSIQRRGARLIGGTRTVTLQRDAVLALLLDGFAPRTGPADIADRRGRAGLTTLGLPYTADAAIPRHVNAFLRRHVVAAAEAGAPVTDGLPRPDRLLLNGGVFNAPALVERLQQVISDWYGGDPVPLLAHTSLDTAVARGAARYALGRRGIGHVITGGTARAYYVGVEGPDGRPQALCVAPKGMDDGTTAEVDRQFSLRVDRPVAFPLYAFTGGRTDPAGAVVALDGELERLPPIETLLRRQGDMWVDPQTGGVPVRLSTTLTPDGNLELYLVTVELPPRRWKLAFSLTTLEPTERPAPAPPPPEDDAAPEPLPLRFGEARRAIERAYGPGRIGDDPKNAKNLRRAIEDLLGDRGGWSSTVCRALFDALMTRAPHRAATAEHEMNWLRLLSWCIRPGFGARGDRARVDALWTLHAQGLHHPTAKANWGEWWILWRRAAAGLDRDRQQRLFDDVRPWLQPGHKPPKGPRAHGHPEMIRLLAALERLPAPAKELAGAWFDAWYDKLRSWWPLGRLGARAPFNGDAADVVPPATAEAWIDRLLPLDWKTEDGADFAAVLLARVTGDPTRDIDPLRRRAVAERLAAIGASHHWIDMVTQTTALSDGDAKRVFGDSLPAGLRIA